MWTDSVISLDFECFWYATHYSGENIPELDVNVGKLRRTGNKHTLSELE